MNKTNIIAIRNSSIDAAEAYKEGAFFAEVDWQAARKDTPVAIRCHIARHLINSDNAFD